MTATMRLVVLGLSISSSWGNGHATTYRALLKAFAARGHDILFLERDVPWYSDHRDFTPDFCELHFYRTVDELQQWREVISQADAVIIGSFVPDGARIARWIQNIARGVTAFYDLDTPVTLAKLEAGATDYIARDLVPGFDRYFSFSGGPNLTRLAEEYGARAPRALFCSVDPDIYSPQSVPTRWDLSYLGTYSFDRQPMLERLLLEPARQRPDWRFCVAGSQYPEELRWPENVQRIEHVPPNLHAAFYSASRFSLNLTRADMVAAGYSPSVRLFEAAACGSPIISDMWTGLSELLEPGREIVLARHSDDVVRTLEEPPAFSAAMSRAARARILAEHTAQHRAQDLEAELDQSMAEKTRPEWRRQIDVSRPEPSDLVKLS
jgi:spore maturation protein CgeB